LKGWVTQPRTCLIEGDIVMPEGLISWLKVSPERLKAVLEEIDYGSEPGVRFYALVATSTLIASLGLIANSAAVIIGAMLVAPLMTPIFGLSLALVRGEPRLLGRALRAEVVGVFLGVALAALFGSLPLALEVTPEMLARTQPNLLDLLVAVLAGFAGSYAMIDERLSPTLPGVAIATAIVPPIANTGLCLAVGAYQGAYGSFLLFLANFLSILIVASATFIAAGLARKVPWSKKWGVVKRFGVPGVGFLVVSVLLTQTMIKIVQDRYLTTSIKQVISAKLAHSPTTAMIRMNHQMSQGKLYILATVRTPRVIPPNWVKSIQKALTQQLAMPTELIVRCLLTKDISATGSTSEATTENLNGSFLTEKVNPNVLRVQFAEQALREILVSRPEIELMDVELLNFPRGPCILATLQGPRVLIPSEIREFEKTIQARLKDPDIHLLARCITTVEVDDAGQILYGWSHLGKQDPAQKALMKQIETAVRNKFKQFSDLFATNVDAAPKDDSWQVRVEVVGARIISPREAAGMEREVSRQVGQQIKIFFWSKGEAMVSPEGYSSAEDFTRKRLEKQEEVPGEALSQAAAPAPPSQPVGK
jgi:uncharacterized hydrophobic protein (TIGR00271 family)